MPFYEGKRLLKDGDSVVIRQHHHVDQPSQLGARESTHWMRVVVQGSELVLVPMERQDCYDCRFLSAGRYSADKLATVRGLKERLRWG